MIHKMTEIKKTVHWRKSLYFFFIKTAFFLAATFVNLAKIMVGCIAGGNSPSQTLPEAKGTPSTQYPLKDNAFPFHHFANSYKMVSWLNRFY